MRKSESLPSIFAHLLFFKEPLERFAPVSDSLRSLMTKERQERFALFHKRIALWLTKRTPKSQDSSRPGFEPTGVTYSIQIKHIF